ncbi:MAG: FAD-binding monooxygenase [Acaryochloris sp. SU_5_25]|nr:FAD-binding monooxygenase [Acaryochloris sp. SU_5_25]
MNSIHPAQQAIVIGGSVTGLLATQVLSQHFDQVILIERDKLSDQPESRKGQPQANHLHALLATGKDIMEHYFPGLVESLQQGGATLADFGQAARWHISGDYRLQYESRLTGILMSRPFLESEIRRRVMLLPNLTVLDESRVEELIATAEGSQIVGVRVKCAVEGSDCLTLNANLVVDASGRGSASPRWLMALGYDKPQETIVKVDLGYATRLYRRQASDLTTAKLAIVSADPPHCPRSGVIFPIEGDRWIVTLSGWGGNRPPLDEQGFLDFTHSLPAPDVYNMISGAEPLSKIVGYQYPASLRRHYEKIRRFPTGYLVMGDALCSFDPVYGQGMTSAALQVTVLDELLGTQLDPQRLATQFFKRAAKIIDIPWQLSVGEDFRFPTTQGKKALGTDLLNAYVTLVHQATHTDPIVYGAFLRVMNLLAAPSSLFHPQIVWRVFRATGQRKTSSQPQSFLQQA